MAFLLAQSKLNGKEVTLWTINTPAVMSSTACRCHCCREQNSPWLVSEHLRPTPPKTPDRFPERTEQTWGRPVGGRDPAAHDMCRCSHMISRNSEMATLHPVSLTQTHMYSRLRCVQWVCAVANVLSAVKHTERQTCQEVSGRQVSCHGTHSEARALWKTHTHTGTNHRAGSGWPSHRVTHTVSHTHSHLSERQRRPPAEGRCPLCNHSVWPAGGDFSDTPCRRDWDTVCSVLWRLCPTCALPLLCIQYVGWGVHWWDRKKWDTSPHRQEALRQIQ